MPPMLCSMIFAWRASAGCRSIKEIIPNIIANSPPVFASLTDSLACYENGAGWTNPTLYASCGSDVITLQSTRGSGVINAAIWRPIMPIFKLAAIRMGWLRMI